MLCLNILVPHKIFLIKFDPLFSAKVTNGHQVSRPRAPGLPQGPSRSPAGLF